MGIFGEPLVFVDIETTGLSPQQGRVIEVAAIRVENGHIAASFHSLVDPEMPLPQYISSLTGITSRDLEGAQTFHQIAAELETVLTGAIFVAHNVRFDYSFLKQEFRRLGRPFSPRQLCTVKLSRALYPDQRSHKLASLIERHGFKVAARHRAYEDAEVLWQFLRHVQTSFAEDVLTAAITQQLKRPSLPKDIDPMLVHDLPEQPGVYIFEDETGAPLYVGKSVNIRTRVLSHFSSDHSDPKEFKLTQHVKHIRTQVTAGELEALLLESRLVKELLPLYNRKLRKTERLVIARQVLDSNGYARVQLEDAVQVDLADAGSILAVYQRRGQAKEALLKARDTYDLCPKLLGLEKPKQACFLHQLRKCRGACVGLEAPEQYNQRVLTAFEHRRIQQWPFDGPVLVQEGTGEDTARGLIVDQWCVLAEVTQEPYCEPQLTRHNSVFDLDMYSILQSFLTHKLARLKIQKITLQQLRQWGLVLNSLQNR